MRHMLTFNIQNQGEGIKVMLSLVYVKCKQSERLILWDSMYDLATNNNLSWLIGGDFNVI